MLLIMKTDCPNLDSKCRKFQQKFHNFREKLLFYSSIFAPFFCSRCSTSSSSNQIKLKLTNKEQQKQTRDRRKFRSTQKLGFVLGTPILKHFGCVVRVGFVGFVGFIGRVVGIGPDWVFVGLVFEKKSNGVSLLPFLQGGSNQKNCSCIEHASSNVFLSK